MLYSLAQDQFDVTQAGDKIACKEFPSHLRTVDRLDCRFVADVHCDQMIYLQDPAPKVPDWKGRGKRPKQLKAQYDAVRVEQWASEQPKEAWQHLTLREGEKGDLTAEYLHTHIWVWDGSEEKSHCWHLLVRREGGASEISHYCLSNASLKTDVSTLYVSEKQSFLNKLL